MIIWLNALQQMTLDNQLMIFALSCAALLALSGVAISQPTEFRSFVIWKNMYLLMNTFPDQIFPGLIFFTYQIFQDQIFSPHQIFFLIPPFPVPLAPLQSALQHLGMQDAARQVTQPRLHQPSFLLLKTKPCILNGPINDEIINPPINLL